MCLPLSFQFPDISILLATVDVITMFSSVAQQMRRLFPDMLINIIQVVFLLLPANLTY